MITKTSKRGDVPVTILVIGVIVICFLAVLSFYISNKRVADSFKNIGFVEQASVIGEKISLYKESLGFSDAEITEVFGIKTDPLRRAILLEDKHISVRYDIGQ